MTPRSLEGQVAVVTGAASGIGLATAAELTARGARVIAVDVDGESLADTCGHLSEMRIVHDMRDDPAALAAALDTFDDVPRILINNVGVAARRTFLELTDDDIERVWRANLLGPLALTRTIAGRMIDASRPGSIVFVSSLHSSSVRRSLDYSTSKAAVVMAMRELAAELGPHGIRVNAVSPGDVRTTSNPVFDDRQRARRERVVPLGRIGEPTDIARAIRFLADDDESGYITGTDLVVDGGLSTTNWLTIPAAPNPRSD